RSLLYDQGYTIGGARQRMTTEEPDALQLDMQAVIKETIEELEDVLKVLAPGK
ncbi:MAG TPA: MerR family transcriptional regulator, partial [Halieaceae bacterium]|nr:MerR family transcriptional regulator [Halieaceae bacterium]